MWAIERSSARDYSVAAALPVPPVAGLSSGSYYRAGPLQAMATLTGASLVPIMVIITQRASVWWKIPQEMVSPLVLLLPPRKNSGLGSSQPLPMAVGLWPKHLPTLKSPSRSQECGIRVHSPSRNQRAIFQRHPGGVMGSLSYNRLCSSI